jgi:hypothetical protein
MLLALGWVLGGDPLVGVWLGVALACGAVCWALLGWTRPQWALIGGLLTVAHPSMLDWGQRYLGGTLPVFGGALVIGAWRRIVREPRARHAFVMGLGMFVLAHTRPYEGAVLSVLAVVGLGVYWSRAGVPGAWWKIVLPLVGMAALTVESVSYYCWRVTGDPFRLPWAHYHELYGVARIFVWQSPRTTPPQYHHAVMQEFHTGWEVEQYWEQRTAAGLWSVMATKLRVYFLAWFQLFPLVAFVAVALAAWHRARWVRWAGSGALLYLIPILLVVGVQPYYVAAAYPLVAVLAMEGLRRLRVWRRHRAWRGRLVAGGLLFVCVLGIFPWCYQRARRPKGWPQQRLRLLTFLEKTGRKHLVVVHYGPSHSVHSEWVYNAADINAAPVVWARAMGPERDRELLEYFKDRQVWLLEADAQPPQLLPYPSPAESR